MNASNYLPVVLLYVLLPLLPLVLFLQAAGANSPWFILISRTAGIYAFVWYALQFAATARIPLPERVMALDKRLVLHMLTAVAALAVVLIHTGFGNETYASRLQAGLGGTADTALLWATLFSGLFFSNYFIRFLPALMPYRDGVAGLLRLTHERCLLLHYAMPAGMVLLIAHVVLIPGQGLVLFKGCMVMIATLTLSVYLYHKIFVPRRLKKHPWTVNRVIQESDTIFTVMFDPPPGRRLRHRAGQFCYLRPLDGRVPSQSHPFTLSSGPEDPHLGITVKQVGDFTAGLKEIRPGSPVCIDGAYGNFSYDRLPSGNTLVFIAGGIGVTPMLSMLRDLCVKDPKRKVILLWGARNKTDLVRRDEIQAMEKQMAQFVFEPVLSREPAWPGRRGRIDRTLLERVLDCSGVEATALSPAACDFFICGPAPMTQEILKTLRKMGIPDRAIHTERFSFNPGAGTRRLFQPCP